jgi:hypothetical protein
MYLLVLYTESATNMKTAKKGDKRGVPKKVQKWLYETYVPNMVSLRKGRYLTC